MNVTGKVAIVTGGGRNIGRAIGLALARNGADVVVADIDPENAEKVAAEVSDLGRRSAAMQLDVTDQESGEKVVREAAERLGRVDILVNNAGVIGARGWEERRRYNEEDWDLTHAVNVKGIAKMTDAVTPHMKERRYGKIVNIASIAGRMGTVTSLPYGVSKAGVINLTQAQALELAPFDINVNAVCPGLIWTDMWRRIAADWMNEPEKDTEGLSEREVFLRTVSERIPLGREQTPDDIGNAVTFLASDAAQSITGQSLNVNGGSQMN
jgi:NAD(P)-dependent dehydrogenase (short-subunit alcohol dehydrogenase family)